MTILLLFILFAFGLSMAAQTYAPRRPLFALAPVPRQPQHAIVVRLRFA